MYLLTVQNANRTMGMYMCMCSMRMGFVMRKSRRLSADEG